MANAYTVRLYAVYSTYWRRAKGAAARHSDDFDLSERFRSFYLQFKRQIPELLVQRVFHLDREEIGFRWQAGAQPPALPAAIDGVIRAEVVLFSLPFPADQVVAAVVLDFATPDLNGNANQMHRILAACADSELYLHDKRITDIINELAQAAQAEPERPSNPRERLEETPQERHTLAFIQNLDGVEPPSEEIIAGLLYGIQPPYRPEFTKLERPDSLNQEDGTFAAVTPTASFFYGQPDIVETSVMLTTVQAVGTASRFQRIWRDAYFEVQRFQSEKQAKVAGKQGREDLELLADEIGNLELDLAFSVETAADLGLGRTTSRIDDFHEDLYQVMQIKTRARAVSQMFVRLGSSIRSELTAIESREQQDENDRRVRGALMLGFLSFFLAPIGLILGFFGANAAEVKENASMFDIRRYWLVYVLAALLMLVSAMFALTFDQPTLMRNVKRLRRHLRDRRPDGGTRRGAAAAGPDTSRVRPGRRPGGGVGRAGGTR